MEEDIKRILTILSLIILIIYVPNKTPLITSLLILFSALCLMGLRIFMNLYSLKYYDKIIHILAGVIITIYLINMNMNVLQIIVLNLILAYIWEWLQIFTKDSFNLIDVGFPDGYYDIISHMIGTFVYLRYAGL